MTKTTKINIKVKVRFLPCLTCFRKVVLLKVKEFHGLHDDLKIPRHYPVQQKRQTKKRRHYQSKSAALLFDIRYISLINLSIIEII